MKNYIVRIIQLFENYYFDKNCYLFKEPILGNTGLGGNSITPFATSIAKQTNKNVIVATFGLGGSVIESWSNGEFALIKRDVMQGLKEKGLFVELFLWHQGESNSINAHKLPIRIKENLYSKKYLENLLRIIDQTRIYFPDIIFSCV